MVCRTSSVGNCENYGISIYCIKTLYQNETTMLNFVLTDISGIPIDLSLFKSIHIVLYDTRNLKIARYIFPQDNTDTQNSSIESYELLNTFYSGEIDENDSYYYDINQIIFDNLNLNILQMEISTADDVFYNKGKISFSVDKVITENLMFGNLFIDVRLVDFNNEVTIINCITIANLKQNKFKY